ncbi:hypothetical protein DYB35_012128 [Aphanomyces astaci]|uniref:Uncharacterized protein n=1 Tax=Aphanomyces astaci TaxID=112090 RepID=A0A3R7BPN0_APHAT|nr:hypothetical protein DYB35_012128 [Aphanomyces astaci]
MDGQSQAWELVDDEKKAYFTVMEATLPPTPSPLATNWKTDQTLYAVRQLRLQSNTTGKTAVFQDTLHVPTLRKTLLSISQLTRANPRAQVVFHGNTMDIMIGPDVSIQAATTNSLYELDASVLLPSTPDVGSVYVVG